MLKIENFFANFDILKEVLRDYFTIYSLEFVTPVKFHYKLGLIDWLLPTLTPKILHKQRYENVFKFISRRQKTLRIYF